MAVNTFNKTVSINVKHKKTVEKMDNKREFSKFINEKLEEKSKKGE